MSITLVLRGFVVLGVILMHTTWYFSHTRAESWVTLSEMVLDIISLFAVPLVMFVSGYMFISHNGHADHYKWPFFKKMFLSVFAPYALFSLLYVGGAYLFANHGYSLHKVIYLLATGSSAVHMGFFRALFGFYVIYPLLLRYFNNCRMKNRLPSFFIQMIFLQVGWKILNNIVFTDQYVLFLIGTTTFLRYIAYFTFGMAAATYYKQLLLWLDCNHGIIVGLFVISLPAVIVCWIAKYYWHSYHFLDFVCFPLNLVLYTITIAMLFRHAHTLEAQDSLSKRFIMYLGNYSFGIFLIHIVFMYLGDRLLTYMHITPVQVYFYPLLFVIMLSLSLLSMELLTKISWSHYLVGNVGKVSCHKHNEKFSE